MSGIYVPAWVRNSVGFVRVFVFETRARVCEWSLLLCHSFSVMSFEKGACEIALLLLYFRPIPVVACRRRRRNNLREQAEVLLRPQKPSPFPGFAQPDRSTMQRFVCRTKSRKVNRLLIHKSAENSTPVTSRESFLMVSSFGFARPVQVSLLVSSRRQQQRLRQLDRHGQ